MACTGDQIDTLLPKFTKDVKELKHKLVPFLHNLKNQGCRIVGVSASAKGNTLLNYCGIDSDLLDYITDISPLKIGKYTPGSHIKVEHDDKLVEEQPEFALLLACNFKLNIVKAVRERGYKGKFIVPYPELEII